MEKNKPKVTDVDLLEIHHNLSRARMLFGDISVEQAISVCDKALERRSLKKQDWIVPVALLASYKNVKF